jgi:hypothetical protein
MCYLGAWVFEHETCKCEEMIEKGEFDKVCPECKKGIQEGRRRSPNGSCKVF